MRKHTFDQHEEPGFSVGFPIGVITVLMMGITAYLIAFDARIPPPQTAVYLASDSLPAN